MRLTSIPGPSVLLVAPPRSYRIAAYQRAACALGLRLIVVSQGEAAVVPAWSDGLQVNLDEIGDARKKILELAGGKTIAAVLASDDSTVELAQRVAADLGLKHNPVEAARYARRKDLARECLARHGVAVPRYCLIDITGDVRGQVPAQLYPCVAKPLSMSGSRGVIRANGPEELIAAIDRIAPMLNEKKDRFEATHVLVEQYVPGREFAVEALLRDGELHVLTIFDKPDPMEGPYFEETYYIAPARIDGDTAGALLETTRQACAAYGLREGPVHAELRVSPAGPVVLEVAARTIGGQCAKLLEYMTGRSLEELVISAALSADQSAQSEAGGAGVLMIPIPCRGVLRRVEGQLAARRVRYIEDVEISVAPGYELVPLPEGSSYLGFIFARAPSADLAEAALREAHALLKVVVAPLLDVRVG